DDHAGGGFAVAAVGGWRRLRGLARKAINRFRKEREPFPLRSLGSGELRGLADATRVRPQASGAARLKAALIRSVGPAPVTVRLKPDTTYELVVARGGTARAPTNP